MVAVRCAEAGSLRLLAQDCTQPSSYELVDGLEGSGVRVFEVVEPSSKHRVEASDNAREALATRAFGLGPDAIFETVKTLFTNRTPSSFKPVAEELEPFSPVTAVAQMRLVWMQTKAVVLYPSANEHQGGLCFFAALA